MQVCPLSYLRDSILITNNFAIHSVKLQYLQYYYSTYKLLIFSIFKSFSITRRSLAQHSLSSIWSIIFLHGRDSCILERLYLDLLMNKVCRTQIFLD